MFGLSTLSVLFSYLLYQFGKKGTFKNVLQTGRRNIRSGYIRGQVPLYLKPLLGKLQAVIWYKENFIPPTFITKIPIRRFEMKLPVEHIRVYHVKEMNLLFMDFLRMYRLPATVYSVVSFARYPEEKKDIISKFQPQQFEEDAAATEQRQSKPGEWLQFKYFEAGDDFRRIIWPLYAKSRELFVRQQEPDTIYAQRIRLIVYFDLDNELNKHFPVSFLFYLLDKYKNEVYSIYKELKRRGSEVEVAIPGEGSSILEEEIREMITVAQWRMVQDHYEIPENHFVVLPAWYPAPLGTAVLASSPKGIYVVRLLKGYRVLEKDKWYWKWLLRTHPRNKINIQQLLPPKKILKQLQREELHKSEIFR